MEISVWVDDREFREIELFAQKEGLSVSETLRRAVMEKVEEERDRITFDESIYAYERNPFSFSLSEVLDELRIP